MSFFQREALVSDNPLAIVAGGWYVCALPIELFRAMSKLDDQIDIDHPWGPAFFLPEIETGPIIELMAWIRQLVETEDNANFDVTRDEKGDLRTLHDLSLVRAARLLGMDLYVNKVFNVYVKHIKSGCVSSEDVDVVVKLALKKDDSLLLHLGKRIGEMVLSGDAAESHPWLQMYLKDNPWLKLWVERKIAEDNKDSTKEAKALC